MEGEGAAEVHGQSKNRGKKEGKEREKKEPRRRRVSGVGVIKPGVSSVQRHVHRLNQVPASHISTLQAGRLPEKFKRQKNSEREKKDKKGRIMKTCSIWFMSKHSLLIFARVHSHFKLTPFSLSTSSPSEEYSTPPTLISCSPPPPLARWRPSGFRLKVRYSRVM